MQLKYDANFDDIISSFIVKRKSAQNFIQIGSSNHHVMFFHFQSSKCSCVTVDDCIPRRVCITPGHPGLFPWSGIDAKGES